MISFAVTATVLTLAATLYFDFHPEFRSPYLGDLAEAYGRRKGPTLLAVGSSRSLDGLDVNRLTVFLRESLPERKLSAFAATITGSGPVTQELILDSMLAAGPKPEVVLLEVNPEFLDSRRHWLSVSRDMTWGNLLELQDEGFRKFGARLLESRFLPFYSRRFNIRRVIWRWGWDLAGQAPPKLDPLEQDVPTILPGFIADSPIRPKMTEELAEVQRRLASPPLGGFQPTGSAARALVRMLDRCKKLAIPVLMVDAPVCSRSREAVAPAKREYSAYIARLLERFSNARYCDAAALIPDEGFKDQHHPNAFGQDLLCRRVAKEILPEAFAGWIREVPGLASKKEFPVR